MKLHELRAKRADLDEKRKAALSKVEPLCLKDEKDFSADDRKAYDSGLKEVDDLKKEMDDLEAQIKRLESYQERMAETAQPVAGQEKNVPAAPETDKYVKEKSLLLGGVTKMIGLGGGNIYTARQAAAEVYGESHPVTKALITSSGSAGGFIVPPDVMNEVIPMLRARAVVRSAGPRNLPMPRGTMTLPGQTAAATASYGNETKRIPTSQPKLGQIVASFKKLTALVPVSNDMMRFSDPAVDALVRDDLVKVMALREDLAFLMGDGTEDTPRGFLSFANSWVKAGGGTVGKWLTNGNSIFAINGDDPPNSTGGNFVTSNPTYTLETVGNELGSAVNRLDMANVPEDKRFWFMNPRSFNYLNNVRNSLGLYAYRDELSRGTLLGYPFKKTTQLGTGYWSADGSAKDLSFVMLVEMTEDIILDSMQLELMVFNQASYVDATGANISAVQYDQTVIRAITEHDHQMRHDAAVAVIQGVRWAPAIQ